MAWNLCPTAPLQHGSACWFGACPARYLQLRAEGSCSLFLSSLHFVAATQTRHPVLSAEDRTVSGIVGNDTVLLLDVPAGAWSLVVKGDSLWKVSAGVFNATALAAAASAAKAAAATAAARACWAATASALSTALGPVQLSGLALLQAGVGASLAANLTSIQDVFALGVLLNSTAQAESAAAIAAATAQNASFALQAAQCGSTGAPGGAQLAPSAVCAAYAASLNASTAAAAAAFRQAVGTADLVGAAAAAASLQASLQALAATAPELVPLASGGSDADPSAAAQYLALVASERATSVALRSLGSAAIATAPIRALIGSVTTRTAELAAATNSSHASNNPLAPVYTVARLQGGGSAYTACNLAARGPQYAGTCAPVAPMSIVGAAACSELCSCPAACGAGSACFCPACAPLQQAGGTVAASPGASGRRRVQGTPAASSEAVAAATAAADSALAAVQALSASLLDLSALAGVAQPSAATGPAATKAAADQAQALAAAAAAAVGSANASLTASAASIASWLNASLVSPASAAALTSQAALTAALAVRDAVLANSPCAGAGAGPAAAPRLLPFTAATGLFAPAGMGAAAAQMRTVAGSNRILSGLLLYTTRTERVACSNRYSPLSDACTGGADTAPFGVNPVFLQTSALFDPAASAAAAGANCTALAAPMFYVPAFPPPFCSQLFTPAPQSAPRAFFAADLRSPPPRLREAYGQPPSSGGFPVLLDVSLSASQAALWVAFLRDGGFLDGATSSLSASLSVYNAQVRTFGSLSITFSRQAGGGFSVSAWAGAARAELYQVGVDYLRATGEALASLLSLAWLLHFAAGARHAKRARGRYLALLETRWDWLDFALMWLAAAVVITWWAFALLVAARLDPALRHDVYAARDALPGLLTLAPGGGGALSAAAADQAAVGRLAELMTSYMTLNGCALAALLLRCVKLCEFQARRPPPGALRRRGLAARLPSSQRRSLPPLPPWQARLGLVPRTLLAAAADLLHFALPFVLVFMGYAVAGHLLFGAAVPNFSSVAEAVRCCFDMLLGEVAVGDALDALQGSARFAAVVWFWSYHVFVSFILLSLLLAIIVDAFMRIRAAEDKAAAAGAPPRGVHVDLARLASEAAAALWAPFSKRVYVGPRRIAQQLAEWAGGPRDVPLEAAPPRTKPRMLRVGDKAVDVEQLTAILREAARSVGDFKLWGPARKIETALERLAPGGDGSGLTDAQHGEWLELERQRAAAARAELSDAAVAAAAALLIDEVGVAYEDRDTAGADLDEASPSLSAARALQL